MEPKNYKYKKNHRIKVGNYDYKWLSVERGVYGLKSLESKRVSSVCLEAARRAIKKRIKKTGKLWLSVFPDNSITSKPREVRMGKGKGNHSYWACVVLKGRVIFELSGVSEGIAREALKLGGERLGIKTKFIRYRS